MCTLRHYEDFTQVTILMKVKDKQHNKTTSKWKRLQSPSRDFKHPCEYKLELTAQLGRISQCILRVR